MRIALKRRKREVRRHQGNTEALVFVFLLALLSMLVLWLIHNSAFLRPSVEVSILIEKSAEEQHVSPSLLQAVILTESKFDAKAVSHVGAVGMMQLMPETAEWISEESGLPADDLDRPDENIPLGAWYLNFLLKKYHNNEVLALAAYNAGRGNVDEWVEKYNWGEGFSKVDEIPFPETREFVKTVASARDRLEAERKEKEKEKNGS